MAAAALKKPHHLKLFFSNKYCRAQVVRLTDGHIIADACSWEKPVKQGLESTSDKIAAAKQQQQQPPWQRQSPPPPPYAGRFSPHQPARSYSGAAAGSSPASPQPQSSGVGGQLSSAAKAWTPGTDFVPAAAAAETYGAGTDASAAGLPDRLYGSGSYTYEESAEFAGFDWNAAQQQQGHGYGQHTEYGYGSGSYGSGYYGQQHGGYGQHGGSGDGDAGFSAAEQAELEAAIAAEAGGDEALFTEEEQAEMEAAMAALEEDESQGAVTWAAARGGGSSSGDGGGTWGSAGAARPAASAAAPRAADLELCEICGKHVLDPKDAASREEHIQQCKARHDRVAARQASSAVECGICLEHVMEKQPLSARKFGLLSCDHSFCLGCIRGWRDSADAATASDMARTCPLCRQGSHFVTPSAVWPTSPDQKEAIVSGYKAKLASIDCRHFAQGEATCPFGSSCFYRHVYPDGTPWVPSLRKVGNAEGDVTVMQPVRLSQFLDIAPAARALR